MDIPNTHKQVEVVLADGDNEIRFKCDNLIAPLIQKLNEHGLKTRFCCSGHEDDAFYTMYIDFQPITESKNDMVDKLYELVDKAQEYFTMEFEYKMHSVNRDNHEARLFLINPTIDELRLAVKLCTGSEFEDVFYVDENGRIKRTGRFEKAIKLEIILRPNITDDKVDEKHIQENYEFVMAGINRLFQLVDHI